MGSDVLPAHDGVDEEAVGMGWFDHGVEVPVDAGIARAVFSDESERWLPPVVGIHALHEVETVSPLRIFELARFRIGDSWRTRDAVSRPVRVEFGREPFRPAVVVLDGELSVTPSEHAGTFVRFRGGAQGSGHGLRRALGVVLAGAAVRSVVDAVATRLQLAATLIPEVEASSCSTC
jgi:hypothetical protein